MVHVDNLMTLLRRGALHAPNFSPSDGLPYRTIHDVSVQASRSNFQIPCGPKGTAHDYVPFYFGPLSPMLLKLKTGQVAGYNEGQGSLVYLVTTAEVIKQTGHQFVFSDGHGLAGFTDWYDDVANLSEVDWDIVGQRYWADRPEDNDRQRRKQAEFLVWKSLDWSAILGIAVLNAATQRRVETILDQFPQRAKPRVAVKPDWYYC